MNQPNRQQRRRLEQMAKKAQAQPQATPQQGVIGTNYLLQEIGQLHVEISVVRKQAQQLAKENQDLASRVALLTKPEEGKEEPVLSEVAGPPELAEGE